MAHVPPARLNASSCWSEHRDDSSHTRWHARSNARAQAHVIRQFVSESESALPSCELFFQFTWDRCHPSESESESESERVCLERYSITVGPGQRGVQGVARRHMLRLPLAYHYQQHAPRTSSRPQCCSGLVKNLRL
jgi:hypothetical protein